MNTKLLTLLLLAAPLAAQDLSTTGGRTDKPFNPIVTTTPAKPKTVIVAINDPEWIELFENCWNQNSGTQARLGCGNDVVSRFSWFLSMRATETAPNTYEWLNSEFPAVVTTTLIVAMTDDYCVGSYLIPWNKARGTIKVSFHLGCLTQDEINYRKQFNADVAESQRLLKEQAEARAKKAAEAAEAARKHADDELQKRLQERAEENDEREAKDRAELSLKLRQLKQRDLDRECQMRIPTACEAAAAFRTKP